MQRGAAWLPEAIYSSHSRIGWQFIKANASQFAKCPPSYLRDQSLDLSTGLLGGTPAGSPK